MTQARYYRLALVVPIALPAIGYVMLFTGSDASTSASEPSPLFWLGAWIWVVTMGAVFYGLPYLVAAIVLWRKSAKWPASRLRRWVWILPTLFIVAAAVVVVAVNVIGTHDPAWPNYVRDTVRAAAAVGYVEAAVIWLIERTATRVGWLHSDVLAA